MSLELRCNDRRSFSVVESMLAHISLIGLFQLSIRRCRRALDLAMFFVLAFTARAVA